MRRDLPVRVTKQELPCLPGDTCRPKPSPESVLEVVHAAHHIIRHWKICSTPGTFTARVVHLCDRVIRVREYKRFMHTPARFDDTPRDTIENDQSVFAVLAT